MTRLEGQKTLSEPMGNRMASELLARPKNAIVKEHLLRMVIVDYPKLLLNDPNAFSILGDMIKCRQGNFARTRENFLVLDKHDMIGTHFLIYDTNNLFQPKLVAGFRITYESRAQEHGLPMPIETLLQTCPPAAADNYHAFRREKGPGVQFNTLYIQPGYTYSESNLKLSELLFFSVCAYVRCLGLNHYVGATNDRLKTNRWMERAGNFSRDRFSFIHPEVQDPHTLYFIDSINENWLRESFKAFAPYWQNSFNIIPPQIYKRSFAELYGELLSPQSNKHVS